MHKEELDSLQREMARNDQPAEKQPLDRDAITFEDLFSIQDVQRLQDEFALATGVASIITRPDGTPLTSPSNSMRLCAEIIQKTEKGHSDCLKSFAALGRYNPDGAIVLQCLGGGLWSAGAGIAVGGHHIANWLIGQVRNGTQADDAMRAYAAEIGANESDFMEAFHGTPIMSRVQFERIAKVLFTLANQLSTSAYQNIQQARFISERKQIEVSLREINEKFTAAFNNAPIMIGISSLEDGRCLDINQRFLDVFGLSREEAIGKTSVEVGMFSQSDRDNLKEIMLRDGKVQDLELTMRTKSGKAILLKYWGEIITVSGQKRLLSIALDITEHRKVEHQLQQAQKMESVGRLAGGVAHDFNNMLSVILGHAYLALMEIDSSSPLFANLEEIRTAAERSADLTRQLLTFARKQAVAPKVLDLSDTVSGLLKMLQRLIGEDIHLVWQPKEGLWPVKVDPSQIDQILVNLCVNARDAIADIGKITIETGNSVFDEQYCAANMGFVSGEYVRITVSDNGCGMDRKTLARIFEPFFTTKCVGKGTGLGLATVYGAIKQNNGFITVNSEPDQGTTFSIYLPRHVDSAATNTCSGKIREPSRGGRETILVVEDEPAILMMTSLSLERMGYTVLRANATDTAISLAGEHNGEIHLLLTDVIMPVMNGRDLAHKLLSLYPQLKCLFMSGYTADVIAHHGVLDDGVHFIQKPFSVHDLAAKVRDTLDAK